MGEAVEGALRQDGIVEERDPLVDGPVGGHDRGRSAVALEDDLVEVARLPRVETAQAEVIDDEDVRSEQPAQRLLGRVIGAGLMQPLQQVVGTKEEHVVTGPARRMAQRRGEVGLPDAHGPEEDHVLLALDEAEGEEVAHAVAIEADRRVPVEALERLLLVEARPGEPHGQVALVAPCDLVVQRQLQELELTELRLPRIRDSLRERREQAPELEPLHRGLEGRADLHGLLSFGMHG